MTITRTLAESEAVEKYLPKKPMQNSKEMIRWNYEVFDQARKATQNGIVTINACAASDNSCHLEKGKWQWSFEIYAPDAKLGHYLDDVTDFELKVNYIAARGFNRDVALTFTKEQWAEYKTFPAEGFRDDPNRYKTLEFVMRYGWIRTVTAEASISNEERHAVNYYRTANKMLEGKTEEERHADYYNREEFDYELYRKGRLLFEPYATNDLGRPKPMSLRIHPQRLTRPKIFYNKMKWDYGLEFFDGQFDFKTERFKKELKEVIYEPKGWDYEKQPEIKRREEEEDRFLNPKKYFDPETKALVERLEREWERLKPEREKIIRELEMKQAARSTFWRDVKETVKGLLFSWGR